MPTDYKDYRRNVQDNLYEAMSKEDHSEVFMQFKYGFTIDISEIAIRVAKNISEELGVKIPTDLHDVYDVPAPFTLDMSMKFVTKYELANDTNTSTAQIEQKLDLLLKTVTSMLYNGDFNDIIGTHHCITSKENGQVYPMSGTLSVRSGLPLTITYTAVKWQISVKKALVFITSNAHVRRISR